MKNVVQGRVLSSPGESKATRCRDMIDLKTDETFMHRGTVHGQAIVLGRAGERKGAGWRGLLGGVERGTFVKLSTVKLN